MKTTIAALFLALLSSCWIPSYFQNPMHGKTTRYRPMPMVIDSVRTRVYFGGTATAGYANYDYTDNVISVLPEFHVAHTFNNVQFLYGAHVAAGIYHAGDPNSEVNTATDSIIANAGTMNFASAGITAAANLVYTTPGG
jgi:hypothetical protein